MKHLGRICEYYDKKGFGFIQTSFPTLTEVMAWDVYGIKNVKRKDDLFFHIKNCSFSPIHYYGWVIYEIQERNGKTYAVNVKKFDLVTNIDYLFDNWSNFRRGLKEDILSTLENIFSHGDYHISYHDTNDSGFCEKYSKLSKSAERKKIINAAKKIKDRLDLAGKLETERLEQERKECKEQEAFNTELNAEEVIKKAAEEAAKKADIIANKSASLNNFIFSVLERISIEESSFVQHCKYIIDQKLDQEFQSNFKEFDEAIIKLRENFLLNVPTREDLYPAVTSYLKGLKPSIKYTYTYVEGYSYTRYKWDGSEDTYMSPTSSSDIVCSLTKQFSYKGTQFRWGYYHNRTNHDPKMSKVDVVIEINSKLLNSRGFWEMINNHYTNNKSEYNRKEAELLANYITNICNSVLIKIKQYLMIEFPLYGKTIYEWAEKHCSLRNPVNYQNLRSTPLSQDIEKLIEFSKTDKFSNIYPPQITGTNVIELKHGLLDIYSYLYRNLLLLIESRYPSQVHINAFNKENFINTFKTENIISAFDKEAIHRNNLTLSSDEKTLLCVDKNCVEVEIPSSVTHINDGAFDGCINLKKIVFLGPVHHIGHHVFNQYIPNIEGDFSHLSFLGYNHSSSNITINGTIQTITEWSYQYNKKEIDNADIKMEDIYIKQEDRC